MKLRTGHFVVISISLHLAVFAFFIDQTNIVKESKKEINPIRGFLYTPLKKNKQLPESDEDLAVQAETKNNLPQQNQNIQPEQFTSAPEPESTAVAATQKEEARIVEIEQQRSVRPSIAQNLSAKALETLSTKQLSVLTEESFAKYKTSRHLMPKPSVPTTNQFLKQHSTSFAAKESNITVISEFGPNEKIIMAGDSCFTVTQTSIDNRVWRGASVWTDGKLCDKYDKFDGQLERSLNKYLKK